MKKLLLLFSLLLSINSFSQNIYWFDVIIDVDGGNASNVAELVTDYYSSIKIPEDCVWLLISFMIIEQHPFYN